MKLLAGGRPSSSANCATGPRSDSPENALVARASRSRGFSLVELMVALVITLILLAGIGQIFLSSKKSYAIQDTLGRQLENGRYATDLITQELRRASYWLGNLEIVVGNGGKENNSCDTSSPAWAQMVDNPVYGLDHDDSADPISGYACIQAGSGYLQGDVLVVRYANPEIATTYAANRLYLLSDPLDAYDGRVHTGTALGSPAADRPASELLAYAYFVGDSGRSCSYAGADLTIPSLYRVSLDANNRPTVVEEIVQGIEQLQVQYGLDTDISATTPAGDRSVNQYVDADGVTDWDQVIAARFWLLTRSECPETGYTNTNTYNMGDLNFTPPANDRFRRQLYQTTVKLRNRMGTI